MHIPSFLVGSLVSGTGYLLIQHEISKRSKLASWFSLESLQTEWAKILNSSQKLIQDGNTSNDASNLIQSTSWSTIVKKWNGGILQIREALADKK